MPVPETPRLLILGGTAEATGLARAVFERFGRSLAVTNALAGRTARPLAPVGDIRIGGFGGPSGLASYLADQNIRAVIDATHPFAVAISAHAAQACDDQAVPLLRLERPPWPRHPLDRWIEVADVAAAAHALTQIGRRVWLTLGGRDLEAFQTLDQHWFLVRMIDRPGAPLPLADHELLLARGPFSLAEERLLIARHRIDVLVAKASGGEATAAKLVAAREKNLPVIMIRRPLPPPGQAVRDIGQALDWLGRILSP